MASLRNDSSFTGGQFLHADGDCVRGKKVGNEVGPLNEAECAGEEVVLKAQVHRLFGLLPAIEVKMINLFARDRAIFIDEAEGR